MKTSFNFFKILCIVNSILFIYLFITLLLNTASFVNDIGLQANEMVIILGRRTSIFMLGISILMFFSRNLTLTKARQIICISTGITMIGLAFMGSSEFIRGTVNNSMFQAIVIEITIGTSFLIIFFKNRNAITLK